MAFVTVPAANNPSEDTGGRTAEHTGSSRGRDGAHGQLVADSGICWRAPQGVDCQPSQQRAAAGMAPTTGSSSSGGGSGGGSGSSSSSSSSYPGLSLGAYHNREGGPPWRQGSYDGPPRNKVIEYHFDFFSPFGQCTQPLRLPERSVLTELTARRAAAQVTSVAWPSRRSLTITAARSSGAQCCSARATLVRPPS